MDAAPYFFSFIKGILFMVPELAIVVACIYYFSRSRSLDSILMSLGAVISLCVAAFYNILLPIVQSTSSFDLLYNNYLFTVISFISLTGLFAFAIGLFMLIMKHIKLSKSLPKS